MALSKHSENIQECSHIFVTWRWGISIMAASILTVGVVAWQGSERITKVDSSIEELQEDVDHLRGMDRKLDTLLVRTLR